jgi:hypothetical protein
MLSDESGADEPGTKLCEHSLLRFFYSFQAWWQRRSSRSIIRTPSNMNTLRKELHRSTIHTGSSGSLSALAKRFSTIPTPENVSMHLREPCRATIPTRSGASLLALISCRCPPRLPALLGCLLFPFRKSFEGCPPCLATKGEHAAACHGRRQAATVSYARSTMIVASKGSWHEDLKTRDT